MKPDSPLEATRKKTLVDYQKTIEQAPPISAALLAHIESMFTAPTIAPNDPALSQKLIFQHGIERVLQYMKRLHEKQKEYRA